MSALQQACTTAKRALTDVSQELRHVKRMLHQRETRDKKQMSEIKRFCMILYILSAGDTRLLQCAWQHQKQKHISLECERFTALTVTELIAEQLTNNELLPSENHFLYHADQPTELKEWTVAFYFFVEWSLAMKVGELILRKHVAAHCSYVHEHRRKLLLHSACEMPPQVLNLIRVKCEQQTENAARKWLERWRKTWGFRYGCLQPHALVLADDLHRKAHIPLKTDATNTHQNDTNNSFNTRELC